MDHHLDCAQCDVVSLDVAVCVSVWKCSRWTIKHTATEFGTGTDLDVKKVQLWGYSESAILHEGCPVLRADRYFDNFGTLTPLLLYVVINENNSECYKDSLRQICVKAQDMRVSTNQGSEQEPVGRWKCANSFLFIWIFVSNINAIDCRRWIFEKVLKRTIIKSYQKRRRQLTSKPSPILEMPRSHLMRVYAVHETEKPCQIIVTRILQT